MMFGGGNPFFGAQRKGFPHTPFLKKGDGCVMGDVYWFMAMVWR